MRRALTPPLYLLTAGIDALIVLVNGGGAVVWVLWRDDRTGRARATLVRGANWYWLYRFWRYSLSTRATVGVCSQLHQ